MGITKNLEMQSFAGIADESGHMHNFKTQSIVLRMTSVNSWPIAAWQAVQIHLSHWDGTLSYSISVMLQKYLKWESLFNFWDIFYRTLLHHMPQFSEFNQGSDFSTLKTLKVSLYLMPTFVVCLRILYVCSCRSKVTGWKVEQKKPITYNVSVQCKT